MHEKEIWKDIPGYEGLYQVNQWGDIYSLYTHIFLVAEYCKKTMEVGRRPNNRYD